MDWGAEMTREEMRAKAIEVLEKTLLGNLPLAEKCLHALGAAGLTVVGPDITDEMIRANQELPHNSPIKERFFAILAAGDLTRTPE